MTDYQLPANVISAQNTATQIGNQLANTAGGEAVIGDILKQKVQEAYNYSKDLTVPFDTQTQNYYSAPAVAREKYLTPGSPDYVANPFSAERLVSQYTGNQAIPMLTTASILGQRFGRYQDLIGSGVNAYRAVIDKAKAAYEIARQNYQDLLDQYNTQKDYELRLYNAKNSGGGSGAPFSESDLAGLGLTPSGETPRGTYTDQVSANVPSFSYISPEAEQSLIYNQRPSLDEIFGNVWNGIKSLF